MVKAVLFDLFETLITEYNPMWQPGKTVEDKLGINSITFRQEWGKLQKDRMKGKIGFHKAINDICLKCNVEVEDTFIEKLYQERLTEKSRPFHSVFPEVIHALNKIKSKDIKLGLVSNCSVEEVQAWKDSCFPELFDLTIFSYEVGYCKPEVEIYQIACNRLEIKPNECIFVGDGGSSELEGAANAGITPIWASWFIDRWTPPKAIRELEHKYARLRSIKELVDLIEAGDIS